MATQVTRIVMKFSTDIHVPVRMNCNQFADPLTFHTAPSSGQNLSSSNTLVHDKSQQN